MRLKSFQEYINSSSINEDIFNIVRHQEVEKLLQQIKDWWKNFDSYKTVKNYWGEKKEIKNKDYQFFMLRKKTEDNVTLQKTGGLVNDNKEVKEFTISIPSNIKNKQLDEFAGLKIHFKSEKGYKKGAKYNPREKVVKVYQADFNKRNPIAMLYTEIVHELMHFLDHKRYKDSDEFYKNTYSNVENFEKYINSPKELFAFAASNFSTVYEVIMMMNKNKITFNLFMKFVFGSDNYEKYYKSLNDRNKKKIKKEIYKTYQKVVNNYEAYGFTNIFERSPKEISKESKHDEILLQGLKQLIKTDAKDLVEWRQKNLNDIITLIEKRFKNTPENKPAFQDFESDKDLSNEFSNVLEELKSLK